jgi:7-carboxy-7-deazaguanine synthase
MSKKIKRMTDAEKERRLSIIELYTCIQSEGSRAGRPTVCVRTTACSHRCWFGEGGWCDSFYTSIHPEKAMYNFNDVIAIYDANPEITEMMLTGGSPTMWPKLVNELTHFANERGITITIETEGSHFVETDYPIGLVSFSPKFSNSIPSLGILTPQGTPTTQQMIDAHNRLRLNKDAIKKSMEYHSDYHMKVVVNPVEMPETWNEIKAFMDELEVPKDKIWIMPPGNNRKELIRVYPMVIDWCTKNYYNFTGREHIIAWDEARGV